MPDETSRPAFGLSVRRADPADADALAQLRWRWRVDEGTETGDLSTFRGDFATWMRQHEASHVPFLADTEDSPVGMAWVALVERVPGPSRWLRRAAYLQSVYVVPEYRGQGIGAELLRAAIGHARSEKLDYLAVHPSERSFSLYRRAGFAETPRVLELELGGLGGPDQGGTSSTSAPALGRSPPGKGAEWHFGGGSATTGS